MSAREARAAGTENPPPARYTPYVDRGNAVPAPYVYGSPSLTVTLRADKPPLTEAGLGFGVGLSSRVWLDGSLGTLTLTPTLGAHSFQGGPNLLLVDTPTLELCATGHVTVAAADGRPVEQIEPGLMLVARAPHTLRVDAGLFVDVNPGPTPTLGLRAPLSLAFQITPHVFAALNTGLSLGDVADAAGTTAIPVGVTLGWGERFERGSRPIGVGVMPSILFPELIKPGAAEVLRPGYAVGLTLIVASRLW